MIASQNITQGTHYLNGTVTYENGLGKMLTSNVSMPVSVVINSPKIIVSLAGSEPSSLYAGANQSVELLVQNIGTGTARNISAEFTNGPSISVSSSVNRFFINSLPGGGSATEQIYVNTYGQNITNTSIGAHLSYENANYNKTYTSNQQLKLNVEGSALYSVVGSKASLSIGSTYVPVTFQIKNTGNEPANSVLLTMESVYPVSMVSSTYYINGIAPNQTVNATFYVSVDSSGQAGDYPITLYEQWKQPNSPQSLEFSGSTQYFVAVGTTTSNAYGYVEDAIGIIVLLLIIAFIVRRARKNRSKSKDEKPKRKA
jgi:hypothetical protein